MPLSQKARLLLDRVGANRPPEAIELHNFKAYGEKGSGRIPLKPITLVFGRNSAGKSSLLHSLLWLDHGITTGEWDLHHPRLSGDMIDLGGFENFVHKHEGERTIVVTLAMNGRNRLPEGIELTLGIGKVTEAFDDEGTEDPTDPVSHWERNRYRDLEVPEDSIGIRSYEISHQGETVLRFTRRKSLLKIDVFSLSLHLFENLAEPLPKQELPALDQERLDQAIARLLGKIPFQVKARTLLGAGVLPSPYLRSRAGLSQDRNPGADLDPIEDRLLKVISTLTRAAASNLGANGPRDLISTVYLGPIRVYPDRDFTMVKETDRGDWLSSGLFAWELLKELPKARERVNRLLKEVLHVDYEFQIANRSLSPEEAFAVIDRKLTEHFVARGQEQDPDDPDPQSMVDELSEEISELLETAATSNNSGLLRLVDSRSGTPLTAKDVGMGISQVVPILVATSALSAKTICMEQPELHLHPALQANLADAMIDSALSRTNTLVIETHSEHLILRLLRRIRETTRGKLPEGKLPLRPADIAVLYVKAGEEGSEVRELRVNDQGRFIDNWPNGFFEERFNEEF